MTPGWFKLMLAVGLGFATSLAGATADLRASRPEVASVIESQLAAFRAGDATRAYGHASGPLRAQTSLRAFAAIVQANYPESSLSNSAFSE